MARARGEVPLRGGAGAVVALVALVAALAWDAGVRHGAAGVTGFTKLNTSYTVEIDR